MKEIRCCQVSQLHLALEQVFLEDQLEFGAGCHWVVTSRSKSLGQRCFKGNEKDQGMFPRSHRVVTGLGVQRAVSGVQVTV